jgi:hypothetical protein
MLTRDIAAALGASLVGDDAKDIARIVHPDDAEYTSDLAVAISSDMAAALTRTRAEAAVVSAKRMPDKKSSQVLSSSSRAAQRSRFSRHCSTTAPLAKQVCIRPPYLHLIRN